MSVVRAQNILCSPIFAVLLPILPQLLKKKTKPKPPRKPQTPSCLRWNLPQKQILQVNLLLCTCANYGELWDSQECSKTSQGKV